MNNLALDYLVLVFLSGCGVLQIAAAHSRLYGLLFLRRPHHAMLLGLSLLLLGFLWFFIPGPRHIPDIEGGLAGSQHAGLFVAGASMALAVTLLLSSLLNRRRMPGMTKLEWGLDALRQATYLNALHQGVKALWRERRRWTKMFSSG